MNKYHDVSSSHTELAYRKSIRLKHYDYSQAGFYFVTICVQHRLQLFGEVRHAQMILNPAGLMVKTVWDEMSAYYQGIATHGFVVMPNHVHGIVQILTLGGEVTFSLADIVHRFKSLTTTRYIKGVNANGWPRFNKRLWQRNYHEHVIRDQKGYNQLSEYIQFNPLRWQEDKYFGR